MKTYEVLEKALAEIEDEENWTKGCSGWDGPKLCAEGAICKASGEAFPKDSPAYHVLFEIAAYGFDLYQFNDDHTHAEVVALFQEAIRNEKAKEGIDVPLVSTEPAEPTAVGAEPCLR